MENRTEPNASRSDPIAQPTVGLAIHFGIVADMEVQFSDMDEDAVLASVTVVATQTNTKTTAAPANISIGSARFHGNGIGAGTAASRRTASMTDAQKPEDGTSASS